MSYVTTKKHRSPFKWFGGKYYLARRIIRLFGYHGTYIEPYAGGLNVLLNKNCVGPEYVSDVHPGLCVFWRTVASPKLFPGLASRLAGLSYSRDTFDRYRDLMRRFSGTPPRDLNPIEYASGFLVVHRMSLGGRGDAFSWSERTRGKTHPDGPAPEGINAWRTMIEGLPATHERMKNVVVRNWDALKMIREHDISNAVIYCDPPYLKETRKSKEVYDHEMTEAQHFDMLNGLRECRGKVFLSGYRSPMYDEALKDWKRHDFPMANHSGHGKVKQNRIECLWVNRE